MTLPKWLRVTGFVVYALAVVIATHWPKLQIDSPYVERPDLIIHIVVFGGWALALLLSGLLRAADPRRRAMHAWLISAGYAALDELTQELPGIHRTAGLDDWAANVTGITIACAAWLAFSRWSTHRKILPTRS